MQISMDVPFSSQFVTALGAALAACSEENKTAEVCLQDLTLGIPVVLKTHDGPEQELNFCSPYLNVRHSAPAEAVKKMRSVLRQHKVTTYVSCEETLPQGSKVINFSQHSKLRLAVIPAG